MGSFAHFSGLNTSVDDQARLAAQAGCNYQFDHWVVGAEGELAEGFWSGQGGRFNQDIALRGGYAIDKLLLFGKVGAGFAQSRFGLSVPTQTLVPRMLFGRTFFFPVPGPNVLERTQQDRIGLLLGGGTEYAIGPHWSVKAEIDYVNYDARNVAFTGVQPRNINVGTSQLVGDVGVNYHF